MFKILYERMRQGKRTVPFPVREPALPGRFRGLPAVDGKKCKEECAECVNKCPTGAVRKKEGGKVLIDMGKCLFCPDCARACPCGAIDFSGDHRLAARERNDLIMDGSAIKLAGALEARTRRIFGRSLKLRQVSAGGCNGCELDINVLSTVVFDIARFGIEFVASPRHADGLFITGPVTENMRQAVLDTYDAVPSPRIVIASGACAISGGPFIDHSETHNGALSILPVDLYIPGCPPHPLTIMDGLLRLLGRI